MWFRFPIQSKIKKVALENEIVWICFEVALPNYQYVNVLFSASGIILPGEDDTKVSFYVDDRLSSSFYNDY